MTDEPKDPKEMKVGVVEPVLKELERLIEENELGLILIVFSEEDNSCVTVSQHADLGALETGVVKILEEGKEDLGEFGARLMARGLWAHSKSLLGRVARDVLVEKKK